MKSRSVLVGAMLVTLCLAGCGEPPPPPIAKDKFEKIAIEQFHLSRKVGNGLADVDKLFKKHGVSRADFNATFAVYGEPEAVKKERQAFVNKMTIGVGKGPAEKSGDAPAGH